MDHRTLAKALVEQLRRYTREKTPHNNIVAIPVVDLFAWAGATEPMSASSADMEASAQLLHDAKICQIVLQQNRRGGVTLQLTMSPEGHKMTDDQIIGRLFPERS